MYLFFYYSVLYFMKLIYSLLGNKSANKIEKKLWNFDAYFHKFFFFDNYF